ncbi:cytosol aminopeptidase family, catalytic domain containing family [Babesia caballi]|uniref:Cytosol aminopeptidase family, catalytic domain containing family n=1 Tax=Babesia caballi TaxID=5871 RepID=A0AAV4LM31_BABCB|nr:cytosol aminopeptidase family, catalytic domain containing family [Babesia caballi]
MHLRVVNLMRFVAIAAVLSGMAQTSAIYCMADYSMPGGASYVYERATAFFVGCALAGPVVSCWFMGNWFMRLVDADFSLFFTSFQVSSALTVLCATLTTYIFMSNEHKTCLDEECWFPLLVSSPCHIPAASLKRQMSSLYLPLLWTVNPVFIAFVIALTLNASSLNLVFWQFLVYAFFSALPPFMAFMDRENAFFGLPRYNSTRSHIKSLKRYTRSEVLKTSTANAYQKRCNVKELSDVAADQEARGASLMRPASNMRKSGFYVPRVSSNTQWSLLKGELWAKWQNRDATYRLCSEALEDLYQTVMEMLCLESGSFYDNVEPMVEKYRNWVSCTGSLHDMPFSIDTSWEPTKVLHGILLHEKAVIMLHLERTGKMYAEGLTDRIKDTTCSLSNRVLRVGLCCVSVLRTVVNNVLQEEAGDADSSHIKSLRLGGNIRESLLNIPDCSCCNMTDQKDVQAFLHNSVDAVKARCDSMIRDISQQKWCSDDGGQPQTLGLEAVKRLACMLRGYCESVMLLVNMMLLVDEMILLQEWLCKMCWKLSELYYKLEDRGRCDCYLAPKSSGDHEDNATKCPWICFRQLVHMLCQALVLMHSYKSEVTTRIKNISKCCVDGVQPEMLRSEALGGIEVFDALRTLVILVFAMFDLINLEECLKKKNGEQFIANPVTNSKCKSTYHLLLPSAEYLVVVAGQIISPDETYGGHLIDDVVLWYSGLLRTMWQLCPEMDLNKDASYIPIIRKDEDLDIVEPKDEFLGKDVELANLLNTGVLGGLIAKNILDNRSKAYTATYNGSDVSGSQHGVYNSASSPAHNSSSGTMSDGVSPSTPCAGFTGQQDLNQFMATIKAALACGRSISACNNQVDALIKTFDPSKLNLPATPEQKSCDEDCCKNEAEVVRFAKFVSRLVTSVADEKNLCQTQTAGKQICDCCSSSSCTLCKSEKHLLVFKILEYFFGCSKCTEVKCDNLSCNVLWIISSSFKDVFQQDLKICTTCVTKHASGSSCSGTFECQMCTGSPTCELCTKLKSLTASGNSQLCRNAECWRQNIRCLVLCGKTCTGTPKPCETKECDGQCPCEKSQPCKCQSCPLKRLSTAMFYCKTCISGGNTSSQQQTTTTTSCSCGLTDCACQINLQVTSGSKVAMGTNCCSHRLGCALNIMNQDLTALKANAGYLKENIAKISSCVDKVKAKVQGLNSTLDSFYSLLLFAHCGIEARREKLAKLYDVSDRVQSIFPCYGKEIKAMAKKEDSVVQALLGLLQHCLYTAYNEMRLVSSVTWTFATVVMQNLRLKHLNKNLSHLKGDMNRNWSGLLNLKGSHPLAFGNLGFIPAMSNLTGLTMVDSVHGGYMNRADARRGVEHNVGGLNYAPFSICLKYIWVLLCFVTVMRLFGWFGVQEGAKGSTLLMTLITALSALQVATAVRGSALHASAFNGSTGRTGTRINVMVLLGLIVIFFLSWISNLVSGYSGMSSGLTYVTHQLRVAGIYDSGTSSKNHLVLRTVSETIFSDMQSFHGLFRFSSVYPGQSMSSSPYIWGSLAMTTAVATSFTDFPAVRKTVKFPKFFKQQNYRYYKTVDWILDLSAFLSIYPERAEMLNETTHFTKNLDLDVQLLWYAWEAETLVTDEVLRNMALCEDLLYGLNKEFLEDMEQMQNKKDMLNVLSAWNAFYDVQANILPQKVLGLLSSHLLTKGQRVVQQEEVARQISEDWEKYYTWLAYCTWDMSSGNSDWESAISSSSQMTRRKEDKPERRIGIRGYFASRYKFNFDRLLTKLRLTKSKIGIETANVDNTEKHVDGLSSAGEPSLQQVKASVGTPDHDSKKIRAQKLSEKAKKASSVEKSRKRRDGRSERPTSKEFDVDKVLDTMVQSSPGGNKGKNKGVNETKPIQLNAGANPPQELQPSNKDPVQQIQSDEKLPLAEETKSENVEDLIDSLTSNGPCKECLEHFKRAHIWILSEEEDLYLPAQPDCCSEFEDIMELSGMIELGEKWKRRKTDFCATMGDNESSCMEAVEAAFEKLVAFTKGNPDLDDLTWQFYNMAFGFDPKKAIKKGRYVCKTPLPPELTEENEEIAYYKSSLLSMYPKQGNGADDARRRDVLRAIQMDDSDDNWWHVLTWLGRWSVFNGMPISQREARYLL